MIAVAVFLFAGATIHLGLRRGEHDEDSAKGIQGVDGRRLAGSPSN
jgi:hypothetical protein